MANGKLIEADQELPNCDLTPANHVFKINLLPVSLGSFDIVVRMDWLSKHQAEIVCHEKIIRILLPDRKTLSVQGQKANSKLGLISYIKARKYLRKGYQAIIAHVTEKQPEEKKT